MEFISQPVGCWVRREIPARTNKFIGALDDQCSISIFSAGTAHCIDKSLMIRYKDLRCDIIGTTGFVGAGKHYMLVKVAKCGSNLLPIGLLPGIDTIAFSNGNIILMLTTIPVN